MQYNIKNDITVIRKYFGLSQQEFANVFEINRLRIARIESGQSYPKDDFLEKIYSFCYRKGLRLNLQKELFYKDDLPKGHILLTHASKSEILGDISISKGRGSNDFGHGFYCGDSYDSSITFACRFPKSSIYFVDFDPRKLKCLKFGVDTKWMIAIAYFRGKINEYKDHPLVEEVVLEVENADFVMAPIADNRMFQIIDSFIDGEITDEQCKHCLAATNLGMQYVFLTEKSLKNVNLLERCYISDLEREAKREEQADFQRIGNDKSKLARIQYKNKGKYIGEILQ